MQELSYARMSPLPHSPITDGAALRLGFWPTDGRTWDDRIGIADCGHNAGAHPRTTLFRALVVIRGRNRILLRSEIGTPSPGSQF